MNKIVIVAVILLAGCSNVVYDFEIEQAIEICKDHKGLDMLYSSFVAGGDKARCKDGVSISGYVKGTTPK